MIETLQNWVPLALASLAAGSIVAYWVVEAFSHDARLRKIPIRVHVNGIRGKSTIVRFVAAALREGGIETIAKTTGSATRVIRADGAEVDIARSAAPTIIEQIEVLRSEVLPSTRAIVVECMALQPEYQRVSEQRMIQATDGVIANVRRDHLEELGETLPEIARSLSNTTPVGGVLYTAETNPEALSILSEKAEAQGSHLVIVSRDEISSSDLDCMDPLTFPENMAIALAIAERHGVTRDVALRGIRKADADPGAAAIHFHELDGGSLYWISLFGVNDVDSARDNVTRIDNWIDAKATIIFVLNNRADREHRTLDFARMVRQNEVASRILLIGDNIETLRRALGKTRMPVEQLELSNDMTAADIASTIYGGGSPRDGTLILIGLANIHTDDADLLRDILETEESRWDPETDAKPGGERHE